MITPYTSQQTVDDFSLRFSNLQYSATLAASTNATLLIPGSAPRYKALMKATSDTWVAVGSSVAVLPTAPTGGALNSVNSELILGEHYICREVRAGDTLNFIATATPEVNVVLFAMYTPN